MLPEPPLLEIAGKPLLSWHLEKLANAGVRRVMTSLPDPTGEISRLLGDGRRFGLRIEPLDAAGEPVTGPQAIVAALAQRRGEPVAAISADLWTHYDFARLPRRPRASAHLVLVDNTALHPHGDLALLADGQVREGHGMKLTFSGIGVYAPHLLEAHARPADSPSARHRTALTDVLALLGWAMARGEVHGEHYTGPWTHLTSPDRLWELDGVVEL
ncbi:MAG TPA: nucleotidyltransferase family protein [Dokdonella sp.]|uniref:nucleotidyltransferase family protein n=1 Tax=Dokdonella sp. TaxID=2291710 RepID=UPI002C932DD4|nr:nucleotidyltransferase family protein [Dokdonella sp.]HUD42508.1 nucleotidyltransferase family protein [Dokdonella sp.]